MRILGIESSCDETAAAVVEDGRRALSSVVATQDKLHLPYRGVVPEIAARAHLDNILPVIEEALRRAETAPEELDAVAVANKPGLIGALLIGLTAAKTLAWRYRKPLIPVNHLHAHIYSCALERRSAVFPCISLVVSGGHTSIYHSADELSHERLGATQDDAAGEAFDKVAAILGLGYPGGPAIDKAAKQGDLKAIRFPRSRLGDSFDFSFSGLKTAVLYHCYGQDCRAPDPSALEDGLKADVAASFQEAVVDVLVQKTIAAAQSRGAERILIGGGVARNSRLRERLSEEAEKSSIELIMPEPSYCVDNGAMVAGLAYHALKRGVSADLELDAVSRAEDSRAPYRKK